MSKRLLLIIIAFLAVAFLIPTNADAAVGCGPLGSFECLRNGTKIRACNVSECDDYKRKDPDRLCEQKGITFPIPQLGGCKNYFECRSYCMDPVNQGKCFDFGKSKGITPQDVVAMEKKLGLDKKLGELPCADAVSCKSFCDKKANFDACNTFAKNHQLVGGYVDNPNNEQIIAMAKNVLGCTSATSCATFCARTENQQKCTAFAGDVGLDGGQRQVGPGGCTSPETCSSFCQNPQNKDKCSGFIVTPGTQTQKAAPITNQNPGPGGCTSEEACNSFCSDPKNSQECTKYQESSGYQWTGPGGCTSAASCAAYCRTNYTDPECGGGGDVQQYEAQRQQYEQQRQQYEQQYQQQFQQKQQYEQQFKEAEQQKLQKQQEYEGAQQQYQQKLQEYQQGQQQYQQKQQEFEGAQQQQQQAPSGVQGAQTNRGLLQIILERLGF